MVRGGWSFAAICELDIDQVELFAKEIYRASGERHAMLISAINLGSHGKPQDIKRVIQDLTGEKRQKSLSVDEALQVANQPKKAKPSR